MAKLNKDFLRTLDALKEKYGEDFENLNGLGETQLSHTDFLDNFTKIKIKNIRNKLYSSTILSRKFVQTNF